MIKKLKKHSPCDLPTVLWTVGGCLAVVAAMPWAMAAAHVLAAQ